MLDVANDLPPISQQIWDMKYRLYDRNKKPVDKTVDDTWRRVAKALAAAEVKEGDASLGMDYEESFFRVLKSGYFVPAGRIIAGAGTGRNVTLSNCFTMGTIPDSMDGIFTMLREAALTMQAGGGIGYDFSTIRPKGAEVKGVGADASGPLTFMDVWDSMCRTVMSAGSRRGAMMATMRDDHPDIYDFIEAKADPKRLRMFNLSVLVSDALMDAVRDDQDWALHWKGEVYKFVKARDLWNKIMRSTYEYAEPGVIFIDRVNRDHNLSYLETIATTNPCGEKPMGPYASCLLGSINLALLVKDPFGENATFDVTKLVSSVKLAIRMMDNVIEVGKFPLPQQAQKAKDDRQLGLGVTGLADALMMLGLVYGSDEAVDFTDAVMHQIAMTAYETSVNLAKEKGPFPTFDAEQFLSGDNFVTRLPEHILDSIRKHGIRNALLLSVAPTGTISLFSRNVSSGIEPVFAPSFDRKVLQPDGSKVTETVMDYAVARWADMNEGRVMDTRAIGGEPFGKLPPAYVDAQTLPPEAHLKMQAAAQKWVDSSISKTINLPEDISFAEFKEVYTKAYDMGCKGCTTYRPNEVTGSVLSVDSKPEQQEDMAGEHDSESFEAQSQAARWEALEFMERGGERARLAVVAKLRLYNANSVPELKTLGAVKSFRKWLREEPDAQAAVEDVVDAARGWLKVGDVVQREKRIIAMRDKLKDLGLKKVSEIQTPEQYKALYKMMFPAIPDEPADPETVAAATRTDSAAPLTLLDPVKPEPTDRSQEKTQAQAQIAEPEAPLARPDNLAGTTYKLKFGNEDHAFYITINDVTEGGHRRPFEVFINSKNMQHYAWIVAMTRMISAIFRRPHDSTFVVEELKAVFDPNGGAWHQGRYVPSVIAAIGGVIEQHMKDIGYMDATGALSKAAKAALTCPVERQEAFDFDPPVVVAQTPPRAAPGRLCRKCHSSNMKIESGCETCLDCGDSKCG